jgi:two-component system NtrC family sensor kinase
MSDMQERHSRMSGWSVRYRLLAIALLPMLVVLPLLLGGTIVRWNAKVNALLISKVNGDLTIAHEYLFRILDNTRDQISALGESAGLRDVITQQGGMSLLPAYLDGSRMRLKLDFLFVVDPGGTILAAAPYHVLPSARVDWPIIQNARYGVSSSGIDIFQAGELAALSPALQQRAYLELVPTPNAAATDRTTETRGMVIQSASPLALGEGKTAVLVGGTLLNGNLVFIDTINDLVYRDASLPRRQPGHGDPISGRCAHQHQCPAVRGQTGARHARIQRGAHRRAWAGQGLAGQRVRRERLVYLRLRAHSG